MRRSLFGSWRSVDVIRTGAWRAVGLWPSLVLTIVSTEPAQGRLSSAHVRARLQRVRVLVVLLRALGFTTSLVLVIGAPLAEGRYGRSGIYYAASSLFALGVINALVSAVAYMRLDRGGRSFRFAISSLWPFAGPYAAERVLQLALAGGSALEVFRELAGPASFSLWVRPHAYDALLDHDLREVRLLDGFDYHLGRRTVEELLSTPPPGTLPDSRFCPRCGADFQDDVRECADCVGVQLITGRSTTLPAASSAAAPKSPSRRGATSRTRRRRGRR